MIRCRKDGNWTGSFRICPNSKGQCPLPQNLHYSLQYSCKRGHGIGLYDDILRFARVSSSLYVLKVIILRKEDQKLVRRFWHFAWDRSEKAKLINRKVHQGVFILYGFNSLASMAVIIYVDDT